jgi:hypothetical protein
MLIQVIRSRRMRWAGHVTCKGERRGAYRVLVGRPEGQRLSVGSSVSWCTCLKGFDRSQNKPLMWISLYGHIIFVLWNCTEGLLLLHLKCGWYLCICIIFLLNKSLTFGGASHHPNLVCKFCTVFYTVVEVEGGHRKDSDFSCSSIIHTAKLLPEFLWMFYTCKFTTGKMHKYIIHLVLWMW